MRNVKKRYWAFILYPESAPADWRKKLQETGIQCAISPLHDKDINPDNTSKKPHYHIILAYEGPTTYNNVAYLTASLGQPIPQPLEQLRGYYRYLVHKDNPEKYQYNELEISTINGFDIKDYLDLTANQVFAILKEITQFIDDNNITEYSTLIQVFRENEFLSQFMEIAMTKTIFLNTYLTSKRHKEKTSWQTSFSLL